MWTIKYKGAYIQGSYALDFCTWLHVNEVTDDRKKGTAKSLHAAKCQVTKFLKSQ